MFDVTILGSGSAGNAAVVTTGDTTILVDAGLSAKQLLLRMEAAGFQPEALDGILLTHEHADHCKGLTVFCRRHEVPIYANSLTAEAMRQGKNPPCAKWKLFATSADFSIGSLDIETFSVPHDAADPVGFRIHASDKSLAVVTDLGFATSVVKERIRGAQTLFIEANYDEKLLQEDLKRPWSIKQRISSRHGHLSNDHAASLIAETLTDGLSKVILGHLSRDCNRADLAIDAVRNRLAADGLRELDVIAAGQDEISARCAIL